MDTLMGKMHSTNIVFKMIKIADHKTMTFTVNEV